MRSWLSQYENSTLSVKSEARLSAEPDKRSGDKGDLRREEKAGKCSFGKDRGRAKEKKA